MSQGSFWGIIIGQSYRVFESNWLHFVVLRLLYLFRGIFYKFLWNGGKFPEVLNFKQLFLKLNQFICN